MLQVNTTGVRACQLAHQLFIRRWVCQGFVRSTFSSAWVLGFRPAADKFLASFAAALLNASVQAPTLPVKLRLFDKLAARSAHALQNRLPHAGY